MTYTRRDLLRPIPEDERFLLTHRPSNVPVNVQLENIRTANNRMFRRPNVIIASPRDSKSVDDPANDNFLEKAGREFFDFPIPRPKKKGWRIVFWVVVGAVLAVKFYKIGCASYDIMLYLLQIFRNNKY